jgi:hypothetical protein
LFEHREDIASLDFRQWDPATAIFIEHLCETIRAAIILLIGNLDRQVLN